MKKANEKVMVKELNGIKPYVFPTGIVVAILLGMLSTWLTPIVPYLITLLVLAGLLVGYHNVTEEEAPQYLLYVTALVFVTTLSGSVLGSVQFVGPLLDGILTSMLAFITPSAIVVGIMAIMRLARD